MLKKRSLCYVIIASLLLTSLYGIPVFSAEDGSYDRIEEIMGKEVAAVSGLDFRFDKNFDSQRDYITTPEGASYNNDNGLDLTSVSAEAASASWRFKPSTGWAPFEHGEAICFQAKVKENGGSLNFQFYQPGENDAMYRFYMNIYEDKITVSNNVGSPAGDFSFAPGSDWADYLVRKNNDDGFSFFVKASSTQNKWKHFLTVAGDKWKSSTSKEVGLALIGAYSGGDSAGGYIKQLSVLDESFTTFSDTNVVYVEDFVETPIYSNQTIVSGVIDNENLVLSGGTTPGEFSLNSSCIPLGGYSVFKIKSDSSPVITFDDGSRKFSFLPYLADYGMNQEGCYYLWKIFQNMDGTFSGFCKAEDEVTWHAVFENQASIASDGSETILFSVASNDGGATAGTLLIDYIELYAPGDLSEVVMTDGVGGEVLRANDTAEFMDALSVVVSAADKDRVLVVGIYGEHAILADSFMKDVPASTRGSMFVFDATRKTENISKVRAFLWDDISGMVPVATVSSAKGSASSWTDDWVLSSKAYGDNDKIIMKPEEEETAYAVYNTEIGNQFDISWNMKIDRFGQSQTVEIHNGFSCFSLGIFEDGVKFGESPMLPWIIGESEHSYRFIGKGESVLLFIDGFFVGESSDFMTGCENHRIVFNNAHVSTMIIDEVLFSDYAETNIPQLGFYDEFEEDECGWILEETDFNTGITKQFWKVEDGVLKVDDEHIALDYTTYCVSYGHKAVTQVGDEFIIQTKISLPSFGTRSFMFAYINERSFAIDMRERFFSIKPIINSGNLARIASDELFLNDKGFHDLTVESYNNMQNVRVYMDGVLILDDATEPAPGRANGIWFMADGGFLYPASMHMDYIKYIPKNYGVELISPAENAVYQEGESVVLQANKDVTFVLNGVEIASGETVAIDSLRAGMYQLVAQSGTESSRPIYFTVEHPASSAVLQVERAGTELNVSLVSLSGFENVSVVEYLVDGRKMAEVTSVPYAVSISGLTAENHFLEAVCYTATGLEVARISKKLDGIVDSDSKSYSNEVCYTALGSGVVDVKNGNHQLCISHKSTGFRYLTDEGEKSYSTSSSGEFRILTDGPIAEVYRNGQFILSFYMPMTTEVSSSFEGNISNGTVAIPAERNNYFSAWDFQEQDAVFELSDLPHSHNLDFVVNSSDQVHLTLNDGYFRNDVTIRDGKIYVWSADRNNSLPKQVEVATLTEDDAYYRIETSVGMSKLYANGRWITTFRNGLTGGRKGILAVDVTGGDGVSYIGVNSNADLYFYEDSFDGSGEFQSEDYFTAIDCDVTRQQESETLLVSANAEEAMAEINAYVGNATLSADVIVGDDVDGVWLYGGHCLTESYTKVGYNFMNSSYEIINVIDGVEEVVSSKEGTFSKDEKTEVMLSVEESDSDRKVTLWVNGDETISGSNVVDSRGTIGFALDNGSMEIDNVKFRGDAKPLLDVRMNVIQGAPNALDMIETEERTYLATQNPNCYYTTNGGKTWENFTPSANAGFGPSGYGGMTKNMAQLANGEIVSIHRNSPVAWSDEYGQRLTVYQAYVSTDGGEGMTWTKPGNANFPGIGSKADAVHGRDATVNRVTQGPSGRIYYVSGEGNSEDYGDAIVWMSDDNGKNWFCSETEISSLNEGHVIAEAVVIETTENTRIYFRTDKGQLCYYNSYDHGITWDLTLHTTPFISSMTCFCIEADPNDSDTLYIAWGYDNINGYARAQMPRTRWSVAKSSDCGENWEMLGTAHENNSVDNQSMNLSINVSKDYIYINGASSDEYGKGNSDSANRIIAFPKDKQRASLRWEQLHYSTKHMAENTVVLSGEQENVTLAFSPVSGNVLLKNQLISGGAKEEYVSLDILVAFLGAASGSVSENGNVELTYGTHVSTISGCETKQVDDKMFVSANSLIEKTELILMEENGIYILTPHKAWSERQKNSIRYALDVFSQEP